MKRSKIAELVVGFVAKGAGTVLSSLKAIASTSASTARTVAGIGAGLFTGFLVGAAQGTVEGDQFATAVRLLALTIANDLAPALRIAIAFVLLMIEKYQGLDQETKDIIAIVGVAAVAITGLSFVFMALGPVITLATTLLYGLGVALVFLTTNPIGLLITALTLAIVAITAMAESSEDLADTLRPVFTFILKGWEYVRAAVLTTLQVMWNGLRNFGVAVANVLSGRDWAEGLREWDHGIKEIMDDLDRRLGAVPGNADRAARRTADALMSIRRGVEGLGRGEGLKLPGVPGMDDLRELIDASRNPLRVKVQVSFESNQQVWESIQKGLLEQSASDPRLDQNLNDIKERLDRIIGNTGRAARAVPAVGS